MLAYAYAYTYVPLLLELKGQYNSALWCNSNLNDLGQDTYCMPEKKITVGKEVVALRLMYTIPTTGNFPTFTCLKRRAKRRSISSGGNYSSLLRKQIRYCKRGYYGELSFKRSFDISCGEKFKHEKKISG